MMLILEANWYYFSLFSTFSRACSWLFALVFGYGDLAPTLEEDAALMPALRESEVALYLALASEVPLGLALKLGLTGLNFADGVPIGFLVVYNEKDSLSWFGRVLSYYFDEEEKLDFIE